MADVNTAINSISKSLVVANSIDAISDNIKNALNGILAHELMIGEMAYIPDWAKIVIPFDYHHQILLSVLQGATESDAILLAAARMYMIVWWKDHLGALDKNEAIILDDTKHIIAVSEAGDKTTIKYAGLADLDSKFVDGTITIAAPKIVALMSATAGTNIIQSLSVRTFELLCYNAALLISMTLVRTGHHYQELLNGSYRALEKKLNTTEFLSASQRVVVYHHTLHPFGQIAKKGIYAAVKMRPQNFTTIDSTIMKRIPVVPQFCAWLAASTSVMEEISSIPKFASALPNEITEKITKARDIVERVKTDMSIGNFKLHEFEAMAAFAFGVLSQVASGHSAMKAPSLVRMADSHLGAKLAGEAFAKANL